jgi:hypothetical protein
MNRAIPSAAFALLATAPVAAQQPLRSWPPEGAWRVFMAPAAMATEPPNCLLVTATQDGPAASPDPPPPPASRSPSRSSVTFTTRSLLDDPVDAQAAPVTQPPQIVWGFRFTAEGMGLMISNADAGLIATTAIGLVVDGAPVFSAPVTERQRAEDGRGGIYAPISDPAGVDKTIGLLPLASHVEFREDAGVLTGTFDPGGAVMFDLGQCRDEARLLQTGATHR